MDARESRFRNAADQVIRSSRMIRDRISLVKNFYLGDPDAPVPPVDERLESVLNPKSNGACGCIDALCEAAKEYRPGEYPEKHLKCLHESTLRLIVNDIEPILRTPVCNKLMTLVNDIHGYLTTPCADFRMENHVKQLDRFRTLWSTRCCENSDVFYVKTSELLDVRKKRAAKGRAAKERKKDSRTSGKGPQTEFKRQQRETFRKFLERKPITASVSKITRAHQCWLEHKPDWDAAAENGTGYSCNKTLARSI